MNLLHGMTKGRNGHSSSANTSNQISHTRWFHGASCAVAQHSTAQHSTAQHSKGCRNLIWLTRVMAR